MQMVEDGPCVCQWCNQTFSCVALMRRHLVRDHKEMSVSDNILHKPSSRFPVPSIYNPGGSSHPSPFSIEALSSIHEVSGHPPHPLLDSRLPGVNSINPRLPATSNILQNNPSARFSIPLNILLDLPPDASQVQPAIQDNNASSYIENFSKNLESSFSRYQSKSGGMVPARMIQSDKITSLRKEKTPSMLNEGSPHSPGLDGNMDYIDKNTFLHHLSVSQRDTAYDALQNQHHMHGIQCSECGQYVESRAILLKHLEKEHSKLVRTFPCLYCKSVFFSIQGILSHLRAVLSTNNPSPIHFHGIRNCTRHTCPACLTTHVSAMKLKSHLLKEKCTSGPPSFHCEDIMSAKLDCMRLVMNNYRAKRVITKAEFEMEKKDSRVSSPPHKENNPGSDKKRLRKSKEKDDEVPRHFNTNTNNYILSPINANGTAYIPLTQSQLNGPIYVVNMGTTSPFTGHVNPLIDKHMKKYPKIAPSPITPNKNGRVPIPRLNSKRPFTHINPTFHYVQLKPINPVPVNSKSKSRVSDNQDVNITNSQQQPGDSPSTNNSCMGSPPMNIGCLDRQERPPSSPLYHT